MIKHLKVILLIISVTFFQTTPSYANEEVSVSGISYDEIYDPIEPINRAVLNFNFLVILGSTYLCPGLRSAISTKQYSFFLSSCIPGLISANCENFTPPPK